MAREWTPQTKNQNETTFRMFKEWLGNRPVSQVARKDVSGFIDALASLPAKYGQLRPYRAKTIREMVKLAEREDASVGRLTQKTINRYLSALSGLFTWARKHGHWEGSNPAEGFIDKAKADTGPKRRPWRQEELKTLFSSSVWTGRKVTRDGRFWLPLLGLIEATVEHRGKTTVTRHYHVASRALGAANYLAAARAHWAVENGLHWVLDVVFDEDRARNRKDHGPENLATLRKLALNILNRARPGISVRRKRKRSGWSNDFARSILGQMR